MAKRTFNYCKGFVICHGLSEKIIADEVKSMLRIPLEVYSRDNGKYSIQINGLPALFNSDRTFKNRSDFVRIYDNIECDKKSAEKFQNLSHHGHR